MFFKGACYRTRSKKQWHVQLFSHGELLSFERSTSSPFWVTPTICDFVDMDINHPISDFKIRITVKYTWGNLLWIRGLHNSFKMFLAHRQSWQSIQPHCSDTRFVQAYRWRGQDNISLECCEAACCSQQAKDICAYVLVVRGLFVQEGPDSEGSLLEC